MTVESPHASHVRGIAFLIFSVSCFGAVDGFSKMLVEQQSFGQIMLARYALALPVLLAFTGPRQWKALFSTRSAGLQIARGLAPVIIGGAMVFGVMYLPLADATVILFAGPFLVVALSGWLLGEKVSGSSWAGVAIGFLAVLIVARPGFSTLSVYAVFPAIAALFYGAFQLLTRRLGTLGEPPATTLAWTLAVGIAVALPLAAAEWRPVSLHIAVLWLATGAAFGLAQYFMARAFAVAPANVLTPFTYMQIVSAVVFGVVAFGDIPDFWAITGIALVIVSGFHVLRRDRPPPS